MISFSLDRFESHRIALKCRELKIKKLPLKLSHHNFFLIYILQTLEFVLHPLLLFPVLIARYYSYLSPRCHIFIFLGILNWCKFKMMLLFSFVKVYELHENRKKRNIEEKQKKRMEKQKQQKIKGWCCVFVALASFKISFLKIFILNTSLTPFTMFCFCCFSFFEIMFFSFCALKNF